MNLWDQPNIPHKGWSYVGIVDLGEECSCDEEVEYEQCQMCGKERIRYIHILEHPDYTGEMRVGCVCASKMIDDYLYPGEQERVLKNRINRRRNFLNREWRYKSDTGNYTLRYKGENITILKSNYGGFGVVFQGKICWSYNGRKIPNLSIAKIVAFDLFDELHDSKGQPQPHWDDGRWLYK